MPEPIDVERLGLRLRKARRDRKRTLEEVSKATGVSVATLSRVERGGSKEIDAGTLVSVCNWMGTKPEEFSSGAEAPRTPSNRTPASTPEAVELYLRADKNLDAKTAGLLAEMFRAAYDAAYDKSAGEK